MVAAAVFVLDLRPRLHRYARVVSAVVVNTISLLLILLFLYDYYDDDNDNYQTTSTAVLDICLVVFCLFAGWWVGAWLYCVVLLADLSVACSWFRVV